MIASRAYCSVNSKFSALISGGKFGSSGGVHSRHPALLHALVDALVRKGDKHVGQMTPGGEFGLEALDERIAAETDLFGLDFRMGFAEFLQERLDAVRLQVVVEDDLSVLLRRGEDFVPRTAQRPARPANQAWPLLRRRAA